MKKPNSICSKCRKPKKHDCEQCKTPSFQGFKKTNYKLYNSTKWRKRAKHHKMLNPLCVMCTQEGKTTPVDVTDHIISIDKGGSIWDESNWQSLCHHHHNQKSGRSK